MRVISGTRKGLQLDAIKGLRVRPTADGTKESIFNVLPDLTGAKVLDLYAGTGNLGIEALSRGATKAVFVEKDRRALRVLQGNLRKTKLEDRAEVIQAFVAGFLARAAQFDKFDLILADPPYNSESAGETLQLVSKHDWLSIGGWFVLEQSARAELVHPTALCLRTNKRRGDSRVSFFTHGA